MIQLKTGEISELLTERSEDLGSNPAQGEFSLDQAESLTLDTQLVTDQCLLKAIFDTTKIWWNIWTCNREVLGSNPAHGESIYSEQAKSLT